jgi:hypothetical protein
LRALYGSACLLKLLRHNIREPCGFLLQDLRALSRLSRSRELDQNHNLRRCAFQFQHQVLTLFVALILKRPTGRILERDAAAGEFLRLLRARLLTERRQSREKR